MRLLSPVDFPVEAGREYLSCTGLVTLAKAGSKYKMVIFNYLEIVLDGFGSTAKVLQLEALWL